jgi:hypothetical protein
MDTRQLIIGAAAGAVVGTVLGIGVYVWLSRGAPEDDRSMRSGVPTPVVPAEPKTETVVVSVGPPNAMNPPPSPMPSPVPSPVAPGAAVPAAPRPAVAPPAAAPPPSVAQLHDRFNAQDRDATWSSSAETNLTDFLAPLATQQGFEIASIGCRQTLCEIKASGTPDQADQRWSEIVHGIHGQPWGREFGEITSRSEMKDGRTVILTLVQRAGEP